MTENSQLDGARLRLARQARGLSQQQLAGVARRHPAGCIRR